MAIPKEINREHVLRAITRMKAMGIESFNPSTGYDLIYEGRLYPPKEVLHYASLEATGAEVSNLHGGDQTNNFLIRMGFEILIKGTNRVIGINHVKNQRSSKKSTIHS
jgi:hypothetical protein